MTWSPCNTDDDRRSDHSQSDGVVLFDNSAAAVARDNIWSPGQNDRGGPRRTAD